MKRLWRRLLLRLWLRGWLPCRLERRDGRWHWRRDDPQLPPFTL